MTMTTMSDDDSDDDSDNVTRMITKFTSANLVE